MCYNSDFFREPKRVQEETPLPEDAQPEVPSLIALSNYEVARAFAPPAAYPPLPEAQPAPPRVQSYSHIGCRL
jgi:hypothetical protein